MFVGVDGRAEVGVGVAVGTRVGVGVGGLPVQAVRSTVVTTAEITSAGKDA